jgi:arylsulfatase A-like enzyme
VGHFVALLRKIRLYDDTHILYVNDHGEYMGYHHMMLKNNYIYDPVIKVPLIVKYPDGFSQYAKKDLLGKKTKKVTVISSISNFASIYGEKD